jgi:hypothetical protein
LLLWCKEPGGRKRNTRKKGVEEFTSLSFSKLVQKFGFDKYFTSFFLYSYFHCFSHPKVYFPVSLTNFHCELFSFFYEFDKSHMFRVLSDDVPDVSLLHVSNPAVDLKPSTGASKALSFSIQHNLIHISFFNSVLYFFFCCSSKLKRNER